MNLKAFGNTTINRTQNTILLANPCSEGAVMRREAWNMSEGAAQNLLEGFISNKLAIYESSRSLASGDAVSRLSPYLHFGQISPRTVMARLEDVGARFASKTFWRRLIWCDLAYWQLRHWPEMPTCSIRPAYEDQEWDFDAEALCKWQRGQTGFPLVDAGAFALHKTHTSYHTSSDSNFLHNHSVQLSH